MNPPMTWARVWRIIRHLQQHGLPTTPGRMKYLQHEVDRMDRYQRSRFDWELSRRVVCLR